MHLVTETVAKYFLGAKLLTLIQIWMNVNFLATGYQLDSGLQFVLM